MQMLFLNNIKLQSINQWKQQNNFIVDTRSVNIALFVRNKIWVFQSRLSVQLWLISVTYNLYAVSKVNATYTNACRLKVYTICNRQTSRLPVEIAFLPFLMLNLYSIFLLKSLNYDYVHTIYMHSL